MKKTDRLKVLASDSIRLNTWPLRLMWKAIIYLVAINGYYVGYTQSTIRGQVVDSDSGSPIEGVVIMGLSDTIRTTTLHDGHFQLQERDEYEFSHLGYKVKSLTYDQVFSNSVIALDPDPFILSEVLVNSISIEERYKDFAGAVELISKQDIRRSHSANYAEILNTIPGLYMHNGALNTNRITIRGIGSRSPFSTNKIRAYYEEIPLTNGSGETTIEDVDLANLSRIEVLKGPNSSIYGSGLGGAILMKSIAPTLGEVSIENRLSIGSFGYIKDNISVSKGSDKLDYLFSMGFLSQDGYRENNSVNRQNLLGSVKMKFNKSNLHFFGYYLNQKAFIPSSLDQSTYLTSPRSAALAWGESEGHEDYYRLFSGLTWNVQLTRNTDLSTTFFGTYYDAYEPRPFNILEENNRGIGARTKLTMEFLEGALEGLIGVEGYVDDYHWRTYENLYKSNNNQGSLKGNLTSQTSEIRKYVNVFSQFNYRPTPKLGIEVGANLNRTVYRMVDEYMGDGVDQSGSHSFEFTLSPRMGLSYRLTDFINAFGSVSHGFSPPSAQETLLPDGLINTNLKPESGLIYEAGFRGMIINQRVSINASAFKMHVKNLLVSRRIAEDQYVGLNAGRTNHFGIESSVGIRLVDKMGLSIDLNTSYTLSDYIFEEFIDGSNDYKGNLLTGVPKHRLNTSLKFDKIDSFYGKVEWRYTDRIPANDENSVFALSYHLVNLGVGWRRPIKSYLFDIYYSFNNVFNSKYASMLQINAQGFGGTEPRYYYPGLPQNHELTLSISLDIKK